MADCGWPWVLSVSDARGVVSVCVSFLESSGAELLLGGELDWFLVAVGVVVAVLAVDRSCDGAVVFVVSLEVLSALWGRLVAGSMYGVVALFPKEVTEAELVVSLLFFASGFREEVSRTAFILLVTFEFESFSPGAG